MFLAPFHGQESHVLSIEGRIISYSQMMADPSIVVKSGEVTIGGLVNARATVTGDITKTGALVRVDYTDLQKNVGSPGYTASILGIKTISRRTMPEATERTLKVNPPLITVIAKPGLYLSISRCHACYYPEWQTRVSRLFAAEGHQVLSGLPDWASLKAGPPKLYEQKQPDWTTEVIVGPLRDLRSLGHVIANLPKILHSELVDQGEGSALESVDAYTFQIGSFHVRTFPPSTPNLREPWIDNHVFQVAFWVIVSSAVACIAFLLGLRRLLRLRSN